MKICMYGIYDLTVERYVQVLPFENDEVAKMGLKSAFLKGLIKVPNLVDYPEKFDVYNISKFDDITGHYEDNVQRRLVLNFGEFVNKEE